MSEIRSLNEMLNYARNDEERKVAQQRWLDVCRDRYLPREIAVKMRSLGDKVGPEVKQFLDENIRVVTDPKGKMHYVMCKVTVSTFQILKDGKVEIAVR